ncbi:MAG: glycosyl hydrolase family 65 protein [Herbinix sp.]|nr:glycosyl hydrolase family 65 protein [Herbinix sp.]
MKLKHGIYKIDNLSLNNNDLIVNEAIFHNANGYIGIRSNYEEGYPNTYDSIRGSYINGFYDIADMRQAEKLYGMPEVKQTMLNVADTQTIYLSIDGEKFSVFEGTTLYSKRFLDMEKGITGRRIVWRSPQGKEVEINIIRMTSFYQLSLFTIEYKVKALNFKGDVEFLSYHKSEVRNYSNSDDPRVAKESTCYLISKDKVIDEKMSFLTSQTRRSGLSVCTGVNHTLSKAGSIHTRMEENNVVTSIQTSIDQQEEIILVKYSVFTDSIGQIDCLANAKEKMQMALSIPLEEHYKEQRRYLKKYWENCLMEIEGDDDLTTAVNYNMYQLIQSVGKDEYCNITAKGLSGEGYEGHYFWDTEMYIEPFFNLTMPSITRNLIGFRYKTLDKARDNARIMGHTRGALYPWRTIMGTECSGYFPSGAAGYHINGDIAFSIISYYLTTKDLDLLVEKGAEIIFETARLWLEIGNYYKGTFRINEVTGPDEYTCMVNNNYFTNVSAQYNLRWAKKLYYILEEENKLAFIADRIGLSEEEIKEFDKAANCMYLPFDDELQINPQDDSFLEKKVWDIANTPKDKFPLLLHYHPLTLYRHQVCKQADTVLAHFIFEDAQSLEIMKNSFDYYEKVTTHDSSLSTCIFSIMASKLGLEEKAYEYFGDSAKLDLFNIHGNTKDGIHTANMGGTYMAIVYGFAGLRIKESGIYFAPVIPKQWNKYLFRINYEDSQIEVEINQRESKYTLLKGSPKIIHDHDNQYNLEDSIVLKKGEQ